MLNLGDSHAGSWGNYGAREGRQRSRTSERLSRRAYEGDGGWNGRPPGATDNLGADFERFLAEACTNMLAVTKGATYICMSSSELPTLQRA